MYTRDEVDVVQNLMFYIETAYKVAVSILCMTNSLHIFEFLLFNITTGLRINGFSLGWCLGFWNVGTRRQNKSRNP